MIKTYINGSTADKLVKCSTEGVIWLHWRDCVRNTFCQSATYDPAQHHSCARRWPMGAGRPFFDGLERPEHARDAATLDVCALAFTYSLTRDCARVSLAMAASTFSTIVTALSFESIDDLGRHRCIRVKPRTRVCRPLRAAAPHSNRSSLRALTPSRSSARLDSGRRWSG